MAKGLMMVWLCIMWLILLPFIWLFDRPMSGLLASILPVEGIPVMGQSVEGTRMGNLNEVRGLLGDK